MIVLNEENQFINTDFVNRSYRFGVLSFEDFREPDFFFPETTEVMVYNSAGIALDIGSGRFGYRIIVPMHWWILCADMDEVQTIPLYELSRIDYKAFCCNPIDGFRPIYENLRVSAVGPTVYPMVNWTSPPVREKDMILIPLGENKQTPGKGPLCAIFSTNRFEVGRSAADIWYADERVAKSA